MKAGLSQPDQFKDNCGFGLIAHMEGQPSHHLLQTAIEALTCMTHRGGIAADGKSFIVSDIDTAIGIGEGIAADLQARGRT